MGDSKSDLNAKLELAIKIITLVAGCAAGAYATGLFYASVYFSEFDAAWIVHELPDRSLLLYSKTIVCFFVIALLLGVRHILKNASVLDTVLEPEVKKKEEPKPDNPDEKTWWYSFWYYIGTAIFWIVVMVVGGGLISLMKLIEDHVYSGFSTFLIIILILAFSVVRTTAWFRNIKYMKSHEHFDGHWMLYGVLILFLFAHVSQIAKNDANPKTSSLPTVEIGEKPPKKFRLLVSVGGKLYLADLTAKPIKIIVTESTNAKAIYFDVSGGKAITTNGNATP